MKKHLLQAAGILIILTGLTSTQTRQRAANRLYPKERAATVTSHHPGFQTPGTAMLIEQAMNISPQKHRRSIKAYNPAAEPLLPGGVLSDPD